jgi:hypothetical protein
MDLSNTDSADDRPEQSNDDTDAAAFIAHEEQTVDQVVASLREQAVYGRERLQTENARARTLTARMVATRRVEDRAMMASDEAVSHALKDKKQAELEGIHKLIEKPYFARIILEEEADGKNKTIEYKLGTAANPDCRIIDWRKAPISKLYYEYREGDEYSEEILGRERNGRVALRNTVDIEKSKLRRISCRFGNFALQGDKWVSTGQAVRSRSASSSGELPGIVSLITADQFKTITEEADTAILIQGIAGSGKTTVALHRLAWLLHENNSDLKPEECVVIVLSNALKKYVSNTLPSLGISGVKVQIFSEWCRETVAKFAPQFFRTSGDPRRPVDPPPASIERVKRSIAVLNTLEKSAERERRMIIDEISLGLDWDEIPQDVRRSFDGSVKANSSLDEMLKELSQKIREIMADPRSSGSGSLYAALCLVEERQKGLLSLDQQLLDVLSDTDAILANDETRLLDGDLIRRAYERTERNFRESLIDPADEALLVRLYELKCGKPVAAGRREAGWRHID